MKPFLFILLGLLAGTFSGLLGIGGGIILVPALVVLFGFTQLQAQGTTLAMMIPPIGILAVIQYYKQGNVQIATALFLCLGFILGGFFGANIALSIPEIIMKKIFGLILLIFSLRMIFFK